MGFYGTLWDFETCTASIPCLAAISVTSTGEFLDVDETDSNEVTEDTD